MSEHSKLVALIFKEQDQAAVFTGPGGTETSVTTTSGPDRAQGVLDTITAKAKEANVKLEDAVIIYKRSDGHVKIKQTKDLTAGKGAGWGSFWGLLVGLIFGGPLAGLLWGLGIGAILGGVVDHGIDDKFLKNVGNALKPNDSAVMILIRAEDYDEAAVVYLKSFGTEMYEADLSADAENAVIQAGENKDIAKAIQAEFHEG